MVLLLLNLLLTNIMIPKFADYYLISIFLTNTYFSLYKCIILTEHVKVEKASIPNIIVWR